MSKNPHYTDDQISEVLAYQEKHGLRKAAKDTGIAKGTIALWKKKYFQDKQTTSIKPKDPVDLERHERNYIEYVYENKVKVVEAIMSCVEEAKNRPDPKHLIPLSNALRAIQETLPESQEAKREGFNAVLALFHQQISAPVKTIDITPQGD